jgi:hypothetical protein
MFMKGMSRITVLLVMLVLASTTAFANNVYRDWYRTLNTTTSDEKITGWHRSGSDKLCNDVDGGGSSDVSCDTILVKSGTTLTGWIYSGGNDVITSTYELLSCVLGMIADGSRNSCAVTSITIDGDSCGGACFSPLIIIADNAVDTALVHEVGHYAGLDDLNPTITGRIMNYIGNGSENRVIQSEADSYEAL